MSGQMWDGVKWVDLLHDKKIDVLDIHHSWKTIAPMRPHGRSWQDTLKGAQTANDPQHGAAAPRRIWTGTRWWPPEITFRGTARATKAANGDWVWRFSVTPAAPGTRPTPMPHASGNFVSKTSGKVTALPSNIFDHSSPGLVWSRSSGAHGWDYLMRWSAAVAAFITAGMDLTRPINLGIDGEEDYGPMWTRLEPPVRV